MENQEKKIIYKDYTEKIKNKISENSDLQCSDINEFFALLNYCFQKRNNFFIENFNKRVIKNIYLSYNKIKSNILNPNVTTVFHDISAEDLKSLRFILINFSNNFDSINNENNSELCFYVKRDSIKRCIQHLTILLNS